MKILGRFARKARSPQLTTWTKASMKVNLGKYQSADVEVCVTGITQDTTDAEILDLVEGRARFAVEACIKECKRKCREVRDADARKEEGAA